MSTPQHSVTQRRQPPGIIVGLFVSIVVVFAISITFVFAQQWLPNSNRYLEFILVPGAILLTVLGAALVALAARASLARGLKVALVITGISALGIPLCAILHNVVYGLMILWLGDEYWERSAGGDEGVFFILALIVFPAALLVGAVISTVLLWRSGRGASADASRTRL
jgi:hypothetical protein